MMGVGWWWGVGSVVLGVVGALRLLFGVNRVSECRPLSESDHV